MTPELGFPSTPLDRRALLGRAALLAGAACVPAPPAFALSGSGPAVDANAPLIRRQPMRIYGDNSHPVWFRRPLPPSTPLARYPGFKPGTMLLRKGTVRREGALPLPCDIVFERDVALKLRDGTTIYTDVFRPAAPGRHPAIFGWSPYGKEIGGQWVDDVPGRSGVPLSAVSELQRFEGADPAFWCAHGYVVLSPDPRGAYMSEGDINFWGRQLAEDGYDFVEWAAVQPWCSGKVAMAGNSWLAMSQWWIAAERPPRLAAIAPWEGAADHYVKGGVLNSDFAETIVESFAGGGMVEDLPRMLATQNVKTPYWEDKVARLERIEVPAYIVASYTHPAHTLGSFAGFRRIASKRKWLRVHNTNEWQDFNTPAHQRDLLGFFDHVMKGIDNGWEATPPVRLAVLDPGGVDALDRPEPTWPLARALPRAFNLGFDGALAARVSTTETSVRHAAQGGMTRFQLAIAHDMELNGYMKLKLWVSVEGADDMDVHVRVEKLRGDGTPYPPSPGTTLSSGIAATGALRVSLRALDPARSTPLEPIMLRERIEKLEPGEIVPVEIAIWPMAMRYRKGDMLGLTIAGSMPFPPFHWGFGETLIPVPADGGTFTPGTKPALMMLGGGAETRPAFSRAQAVPPLPDPNRGTHVFHLGGRFDSHLLLPLIDA